MSNEATTRRRPPLRVPLAYLMVLALYAIPVIMAIANQGKQYTSPNLSVLGVLTAVALLALTAVGYVIVVGYAPTKFSWFGTIVILGVLAFATVVGFREPVATRTYDEDFLIGTVLMLFGITLPLSLIYNRARKLA